MLKFLHLSAIPTHVDLGLLVLRLAFAGQMIYGHGWGKLVSFSEKAAQFPDPFGIGNTPSAVIAVLGEVVCSLLIVLGLFTRLAALGLITVMAVAFFWAHGGKLVGDGNGELAFLYLIGFLTIFIAGPGKYSVDANMTK